MIKYFRMFLLGLVLLLIAFTWKAIQVLPMATGYGAKVLCSEYFVAGRQDLDQLRKEIEEIDPLFALGRYDVNAQTGRATAAVGPGLMKTTAVYRDGLGCTIAAGIEPESLPALPAGAVTEIAAANLLAAASEELPGLESALDASFDEPAPGSHRQTRAIVVLHRGRIAAERYAEGFDVATPLIGWSMTKSISNTLIGMLVKDGRLELDEPAPVPEWQEEGDPRGEITLRNLLQMSSGLDFEEIYEPGSDATNMLFTEYSAAAYAATSPLAHEPGSHWSYSSGTSNILGRIVRNSLGGTAEAVYKFIQARLARPLGLSSLVIEFDASGAPVASSFSYATARDWARLGQFWLQDGVWQDQQLLPQGWMEWSVQPAPAAPMGEYGAQFWLNAGKDGHHPAFPDLPEDIFYASGFAGQSVTVFPSQQIVVVRLGFTTDDSWDLNELLNAVYTALKSR